MAELNSDAKALLQRMEDFLATASVQTIEEANAIYHDPSYRILLRTHLMDPTVRRFVARHVDLQKPVVIQLLKDEIARRQGSEQ